MYQVPGREGRIPVSVKMRTPKAAEPAARVVCRPPTEDAATRMRARKARLNFTADCMPGIRRIRRSDGTFGYRRSDRSTLDAATRRRIERLRIPPAWDDVWICEDERGHLQATGRDARGRKQDARPPGTPLSLQKKTPPWA